MIVILRKTHSSPRFLRLPIGSTKRRLGLITQPPRNVQVINSFGIILIVSKNCGKTKPKTEKQNKNRAGGV